MSASTSAPTDFMQRLQRMLAGKPRYERANRRPGDVFFHYTNARASHTNITMADITQKADSVEGVGVRIIPLNADRHAAIVLRFHDAEVAQSAALIAAGWANAYDPSNDTYATNGVGYSERSVAGVSSRVVGLFGDSKFGKGAKARLLKYRRRDDNKPKHVVCSEMVILAYQLAMSEGDRGFIKLDAKHTLPWTLFSYLLENDSYWSIVAFRDGEQDHARIDPALMTALMAAAAEAP